MDSNIELHLTTFPMYMQELEDFHKIYDIQKFISIPNNPTKYKKSINRTCRFCGLSKPHTTFKNKPHLFSKLTGNKYGYSEFECDNCNSYFGKMENDLAYYLGITHNINEDIVRTHKYQKDLEIREHIVRGVKGILISKKYNEDDSIAWNSPENLVVKYLKRPYKPLGVYKTMLKYAISLLNEDEVSDYIIAIKYLMSKIELDDLFQFLGVHDFPITFNSPPPYAILFKKRNPNYAYPTHCFSIYFQNKVVSLCLPFQKDDAIENIILKKSIRYSFPPPLLLVQDAIEDVPNTFSINNFASNNLLSNDLQEIHLTFPAIEPEQQIAMDPLTGKVVQNAEKTGIKSIFMVPSGTTFEIIKD